MKNNWKKIAAMALTLSIGISAIASARQCKMGAGKQRKMVVL